MLIVFTKKGSYHRLKYGDLKPELDSEPTTIQVDGIEIERLISLELVKSNIAKKLGLAKRQKDYGKYCR